MRDDETEGVSSIFLFGNTGINKLKSDVRIAHTKDTCI